MQPSSIKQEPCCIGNLKHEATQSFLMSSSKTLYNSMVEDGDSNEDDELKLLNNLIDSSHAIENKLEYYTRRALVHFHMLKWNEVLSDINFVETHKTLPESLILIKFKSMLHCDAHKIRDLLKHTMGLSLLDNKPHMDFYNAISPENINKLICQCENKPPISKRSRQ